MDKPTMNDMLDAIIEYATNVRESGSTDTEGRLYDFVAKAETALYEADDIVDSNSILSSYADTAAEG